MWIGLLVLVGLLVGALGEGEDEWIEGEENGYDEDEFIAVEAPRPKDKVPNVKETIRTETNLSPKIPLLWYEKWAIEMICIAFLIVYGFNFYVGSNKNLEIVNKWGQTYNELFSEHFAKVGNDAMLSKQTQSVYSMRATGRINCIGLQALLKLKRRHDALLKIWDNFNKVEDTVVMDIAIPKMDPMVFVIVPTKAEKNYRKANKDVEIFAASRNDLRQQLNFPENFSILSDSEEAVQGLLIPKVVKAITDYKDYIEVIHFTDAWSHSKLYSKVLRFVFKLPTDDMKKLYSLTAMSLFFIDQIASFSLPTQTFDKLTKWRNKVAALKPKSEDLQEAMQKRQEEKRRKEQERYEQMTPEQKAKEDLKRSKKEAKKKSQGQRFKVAYG